MNKNGAAASSRNRAKRNVVVRELKKTHSGLFILENTGVSSPKRDHRTAATSAKPPSIQLLASPPPRTGDEDCSVQQLGRQHPQLPLVALVRGDGEETRMMKMRVMERTRVYLVARSTISTVGPIQRLFWIWRWYCRSSVLSGSEAVSNVRLKAVGSDAATPVEDRDPRACRRRPPPFRSILKTKCVDI